MKIVHKNGQKQQTLDNIGSVWMDDGKIFVKDTDGVETPFDKGSVVVYNDEGEEIHELTV